MDESAPDVVCIVAEAHEGVCDVVVAGGGIAAERAVFTVREAVRHIIDVVGKMVVCIAESLRTVIDGAVDATQILGAGERRREKQDRSDNKCESR